MQIKNPHIQQLKLTSPVILAPMAGITALPYRRIMKRFGAGLVHTEMISANGLIREGEKTRLLLTSHPRSNPWRFSFSAPNRPFWPKRRAWWPTAPTCSISIWVAR